MSRAPRWKFQDGGNFLEKDPDMEHSGNNVETASPTGSPPPKRRSKEEDLSEKGNKISCSGLGNDNTSEPQQVVQSDAYVGTDRVCNIDCEPSDDYPVTVETASISELVQVDCVAVVAPTSTDDTISCDTTAEQSAVGNTQDLCSRKAVDEGSDPAIKQRDSEESGAAESRDISRMDDTVQADQALASNVRETVHESKDSTSRERDFIDSTTSANVDIQKESGKEQISDYRGSKRKRDTEPEIQHIDVRSSKGLEPLLQTTSATTAPAVKFSTSVRWGPELHVLDGVPPTMSDHRPSIEAVEYDFMSPLRRLYTVSCDTRPAYHKGCKWSPDGAVILTCLNDNSLRTYLLPDDNPHDSTETQRPLRNHCVIQETGTVYDYDWFPGASRDLENSMCFATSSYSSPVHMWDSESGKLRCSYRVFDQCDELSAANSLCFSRDGRKLVCGFKKKLNVFDVNRPGRQSIVKDFSRTKKNKKIRTALGIISCMSFSPASPNLLLIGSYSRTAALISLNEAQPVSTMWHGFIGGLTHCTFSADSNRIYCGARKDPDITCYDVRVPNKLLFVAQRNVQTNQRVYFQLTSDDRYLVTGEHGGTVAVYDTQTSPQALSATDPTPILPRLITHALHADTVTGASLSQRSPLLATACGQRHFTPLKTGSEADDVSSDDGSDVEHTCFSSTSDCTLAVWGK